MRKRIQRIFLLAFFLFMAECLPAQNLDFGEGLSGIYVYSSNVTFCQIDALNKKGELKKSAWKFSTDEVQPLAEFRIEGKVENGLYTISTNGKKYLMALGRDLEFGIYQEAKFVFLPSEAMDKLDEIPIGKKFVDGNAAEYTYKGYTLNKIPDYYQREDACRLSFEDSDGNIRSVYMTPSVCMAETITHWSNNRVDMRLSFHNNQKFRFADSRTSGEFSDILISKEDVLKEAYAFQSKEEIDSLISLYAGKEVRLKKRPEKSVRINDEHYKTIILPREQGHNVPDIFGYEKYVTCKIKNIYPRYCNIGVAGVRGVVYRYYATLSSTDKDCPCDIDYPLADIHSIIMNVEELAAYCDMLEQQKLEEERKAIEQAEKSAKEAEAAERRRLELEKEQQDYVKELTRKYGKKNADLILEGEIKIGFTKQMCIEALGEPDNINILSAKSGKQQWVYGSYLILYFQGNILNDYQAFYY